MDNNEGIKPESLNPKPGKADEPANGVPSDALRAGSPPANTVPYAPPDMDDAEEDGGLFTPTNGGILVVLIALLIFLVIKFNPEELWYMVKAGLGLSFVIFVHELGHFLAAKWCDVNVTTFSIGFGPAIPGCKYKWGETTYKLAILPLGGYVQMVGQVDGDEASDGSEDDPRSYRKKTVGQRMLIISAGVIMNAIFAAICFIAVYQGQGKEHPAPVIGAIDSGATAAVKGLRTDARIVEFGGNDDPTFSTLTQSVINSLENQKIPVAYQLPGREVVRTEITALDSDSGSSQPRRPVIGVQASSKPQFFLKGDPKQGPFYAETPAAAGNFKYGDIIVAMTNPDDPEQAKKFDPNLVSDLPDDKNYPGHDQKDFGEFSRRMQLLADKPIVLHVVPADDPAAKPRAVTIAPIYRLDLGVRMQMGPIIAIREGSAAAGKDGVKTADPEAKTEADKILAVSVIDADGKKLEFTDKDKTLDPERLPQQLRQWSDRLDRAKFKGDRLVTLVVRRHQQGAPNQFADQTVVLKWDTDWRFERILPLSRNAPMPIPELGLAYQIKSIVDGVTREDSKLKAGDVIKNLKAEIADFKEDAKLGWGDTIEEGQWAFVSRSFSNPRKIKKLELKVERDKQEIEVEIPINMDETWALPDRGWVLASDTRRIKASDPLHAIALGLKDTYNRMTEVFLNIRGMVMGRISAKNFGGPLTIAKGAYIFAKLDLSEFLFFLGLISINLAVVNFLPIPILDGGHMVFLIYEKLRGKPASEGVRVAATYAGLAVILCLMVFVLTLDVLREL